MRIVDLKTFRAMPKGIIAAKYEPCVFGELFVKGATIEGNNDFFLAYLTNEIDYDDLDDRHNQLDACANGTPIKMIFDEYIRDGCFDDDQMFAVWDRSDIEGLISTLTRSLSVCP